MSERDMSFYVVDIFIAIDKIKRYTSKFTNSDDFFRSEMEWDAALRMLQLMGDAIKENSLNQSILKNLERLKKTLNHG